jgi:hypothetical protein
MISTRFLEYLIEDTELRWEEKKLELHPDLFGSRTTQGTKWREGLSDEQIEAYEKELGFEFPNDVIMLLAYANGWDRKETIVHGEEVAGEITGFYSYPQDLAEVKERIADIKKDLESAFEPLGYDKELWENVNFLPIYQHRYVVCTPDPDVSAVISYHPGDAIIYGDNLQDYLYEEFLKHLWDDEDNT